MHHGIRSEAMAHALIGCLHRLQTKITKQHNN